MSQTNMSQETLSRHTGAVPLCPKRHKHTNSHGMSKLNVFFSPPTCVRRVLGCSVAAVHLRLSQITARAQLRAFQSRVRVKERDEARWECVCVCVCARCAKCRLRDWDTTPLRSRRRGTERKRGGGGRHINESVREDRAGEETVWNVTFRFA